MWAAWVLLLWWADTVGSLVGLAGSHPADCEDLPRVKSTGHCLSGPGHEAVS